MNASISVGVIGLGNMGRPMAHRLLELGFDLTVCDRNPEAYADLLPLGAKEATTPAAVANECTIVLASMPSRQASLEVATGKSGIVHGSKIRVYIETSTLGSATIHSIEEALKLHNIGLVDAPVSGGPPGARAGKLSVMASGKPEDMEAARPVLDAISKQIFLLSDRPGGSQVAKLINNHVSAAGRLAVFEGLAMAVKAGIDPKVMNDVLNAGSGRNYTTTDKVPSAILSGTFKFNGPLTIGLKDETLLLEEAEAYDAPLWIAPRILEVYKEAAAAGYADQDGMRLYLYMKSQSLRDRSGKKPADES